MYTFVGKNIKLCPPIESLPTTPLKISYDDLLEALLYHFRKFLHSFLSWLRACLLRRESIVLFSALAKFLDEILKMKDVYIVSPSQVIDWMKKPTPLSEINQFAPWQCTKAPPPAACAVANACEYQFGEWNEYVYLRTCTKPCPKHYPWYGNPDGN